MKVAVFGLGYVGTVSAACLAANGHDVCGVDPDEMKVATISAGLSPVVEPGLQDLVANAVAAGTLRASVLPADASQTLTFPSFVSARRPQRVGGQSRLHLPVVEDVIQSLSESPPAAGVPHDHHPQHGSPGHR